MPRSSSGSAQGKLALRRKAGSQPDKEAMSWARLQPHSPAQRAELLLSCGGRCFAAPDSLAYPLCDKSCRPLCSAVRAASFLARLHRRSRSPAVRSRARKALRAIARLRCG